MIMQLENDNLLDDEHQLENADSLENEQLV
jgi:hypothetical protein